MQYTFDTFYKAYQAAPPEQKLLIDSTLIPTCVREVVESAKIDQSHYREVVKLYSLFLLNAIDEAAMIEEMKQLGIPESRIVFYNLQICRERTPIVAEPLEPEVEDLASDIAETEAALQVSINAVDDSQLPQPPSRAADYATTTSTDPIVPPPPAPPAQSTTAEPVYTSTQSALLNENRQPYTAVPRWESEA